MRERVSLLFLIFFFVHFSIFSQEEAIPVIKFKDADIKIVLQSIAEKAYKEDKKVNIVISPKVEGLVSVSIENVDWESALKVILETHGYGYKWIEDNVILVASLEEIKEREKLEKERQEVEVPRVKVFKLKYLDANDAKRMVEPILSPIGKASVLETTGQAGWEFGTDVKKRSRVREGRVSRTKVLLISDVSQKLKEVERLLKEIDIMPKQILIKTKIMEVNRDLLKDIGFDWGTGSTGASGSTFGYIDLSSKGGSAIKQIGGHMLGDQITPSGFAPKTTGITTANSGFRLSFRKLTGSEFEVILHTLEEDAKTNTLSAPTILTLNNQEASILVGQKYPIVKTEISTESNQIIGGSLEYYQDIGIQLNVIPQICGENDEYINMIIHPAVTSRLQDVTITDQSGNVLVSYPWLTSREAETQVIIKDGETVVIGGLLKDVKTKQEIGVPFLSKIPILGWLFKRHTYDTEKIDLLIFITAKIIKPGEIVPQEVLDISRVTSKFKENNK